MTPTSRKRGQDFTLGAGVSAGESPVGAIRRFSTADRANCVAARGNGVRRQFLTACQELTPDPISPISRERRAGSREVPFQVVKFAHNPLVDSGKEAFHDWFAWKTRGCQIPPLMR